MKTATQWRERTKPQRRAQLRARHEALRDLKEMEIQFDFLRPCETTFNPLIGGWRKSRTTYSLMTRSVDAMYVMSLAGYKSVRVVQLSTGHFYYLRTINNGVDV